MNIWYLIIWFVVCPICGQTIEWQEDKVYYYNDKQLTECSNCHCALWARPRYIKKFEEIFDIEKNQKEGISIAIHTKIIETILKDE